MAPVHRFGSVVASCRLGTESAGVGGSLITRHLEKRGAPVSRPLQAAESKSESRQKCVQK
jgi:hypothetical protein